MLSGGAAVVCVMSGNFVQRGDIAVFAKHARAEAAVRSGADLVIELPVVYALSSAEGFARGGVGLLDSLGVVSHVSFGSEAGAVAPLAAIADCLLSDELSALIQEELRRGVSFPTARQRAAERLIGDEATLLETPNNILGIEYIKAIKSLGSSLTPLTIKRVGSAHDGQGAESSSQLRRLLKSSGDAFALMPAPAAAICRDEIGAGRGPVFIEHAEQAVLSRLRSLTEDAYDNLPDATEGLGHRLMRAARSQPTLTAVLDEAKTKRYPMARLRRMLLCAALGISSADRPDVPPYIRVLAFNSRGAALIREIKSVSPLPVITKPAEAKKLSGAARSLFEIEAAATDLFVLAYTNASARSGGQEWTISPRVIDKEDA